MLVDNVTLFVKAGNGGDGAATFLRNGQTARGGPNGGNGGNGGNIYFQGSHNLTDLREFRFKKKVIAEDGVKGGKYRLFGKNAEHTTIFVPVGTRIKDTETGSMYEIRDTVTPVLIARGGHGGRGNNEFKTATNQAPMYAERGTKGQERTLLLELRLIADIGLIGLPNAGKSSLLAVLTNAQPKIGDYPFTTLEPNIGMFGKHPIADIPGLIEGASEGRGLGVTFLKHILKTKILLHCIELTEDDIKERYETVRHEFESYNPKLLLKPEIILLTKTDLAEPKLIKKYTQFFEKKRKRVLTCSLIDQESIDTLKKTLNVLLESSEKENQETISVS